MCYLQVYYKVNQPYIYIYLFPLGGFPSHLGTREHWIELPVLYRRFSWVIYLIHSSVHILVPIHTRPLSPYPKGSTHLFSTSVSLFLPCKQVQLYRFSRLHTYALIYDVCFSLSAGLKILSIPGYKIKQNEKGSWQLRQRIQSNCSSVHTTYL